MIRRPEGYRRLRSRTINRKLYSEASRSSSTSAVALVVDLKIITEGRHLDIWGNYLQEVVHNLRRDQL
jgi:hypothetical protein